MQSWHDPRSGQWIGVSVEVRFSVVISVVFSNSGVKVVVVVLSKSVVVEASVVVVVLVPVSVWLWALAGRVREEIIRQRKMVSRRSGFIFFAKMFEETDYYRRFGTSYF